ncbi:MAG: hypothetical protein GY702_16155, partial [Desulfobulbaceae bacterium]|nr:hypothetical protein [Desulfobulbaceae bacterium]
PFDFVVGILEESVATEVTVEEEIAKGIQIQALGYLLLTKFNKLKGFMTGFTPS